MRFTAIGIRTTVAVSRFMLVSEKASVNRVHTRARMVSAAEDAT
jgi:hypothetical protein